MLTIASPFSLVIFGASGHLAKLKLYPELYVLALKKRLPKNYAIVGFSRTVMKEQEFRELVRAAIQEGMENAAKPDVVEELLTHVHYQPGKYDGAPDYDALEVLLANLENGWGPRVRLAYLSVPPTVFTDVITNICKAGINTYPDCSGFRCIIEKPVGHDLKSFEEIRTALTSCFREEEIYLLDHYLGKEAVRNVYYLRFANPMLERLFKNTLIRQVEIVAAETAGLEGRAGYFEQTGTLRDMVQSHLLLTASLLTMRLTVGEGNLRDLRKNALEQLYLPYAGSLDELILQGQYENYKKEQGVAADSRTNTFIAMKLLSRTSRWEGVPFYLKTGKRLGPGKETRISIQFQVPHMVGKGSSPNRLDIILQGEAGMRMHLQTKMGGSEPTFRQLLLSDPLVCIGDCLPEHGLLLLEAIHGKRDWFLTFDEIRTAWRLIDPLQSHLDTKRTPLYTYNAGSNGPIEAEAWLAKDGLQWMT